MFAMKNWISIRILQFEEDWPAYRDTLQVNFAGAPCPLQPLLLPVVQSPDPDQLQAGPLPLQAGPLPPCHQQEKTLKKKYVDDLTLLEVLCLLSVLVPAPPIIGPPNLHDIPGLTLPVEQSSWLTCPCSQLKTRWKNSAQLDWCSAWLSLSLAIEIVGAG